MERHRRNSPYRLRSRRKNRRLRRRRKSCGFGCPLVEALIIIVLVFSLVRCSREKETVSTSAFLYNNIYDSYDNMYEDDVIAEFARQHNLKTDAWPDELIELLEKNPETKDFVLNYPLKKDLDPKIDLKEYKNSKKIPLFMQWDERWGYNQYAGELMGLSGCGPTCLSMVSIYLLNDDKYSPEYVAEFAEENGYSVSGSGSAWSLISEGGVELGLDISEIPLDEETIIANLEAGNPIICIMGPGDFTTSGHFIVMTEYVDGKIRVNDPNSKLRSKKLWDLSDIKYQIRNLWACKK